MASGMGAMRRGAGRAGGLRRGSAAAMRERAAMSGRIVRRGLAGAVALVLAVVAAAFAFETWVAREGRVAARATSSSCSR